MSSPRRGAAFDSAGRAGVCGWPALTAPPSPRAAPASLHLEGAFRATPTAAIYRLGLVADPSAFHPPTAAIVRAACARITGGDTGDEPVGDDDEKTPLTHSQPEVRPIGGSDWYVWLGEGGPCGGGKPRLLGQQYSADCCGQDLTRPR